MEGERDLTRLLDALEPRLHSERYGFSVATDSALKNGQFALVREDEGLTAIGTDPSGEWARISLGVHSSLDAVGLTAALSSRLAEAGRRRVVERYDWRVCCRPLLAAYAALEPAPRAGRALVMSRS